MNHRKKRPRLSTVDQLHTNHVETDKLCSECGIIPFLDIFGPLPSASDIAPGSADGQNSFLDDGDPDLSTSTAYASTVTSDILRGQAAVHGPLVHDLGDLNSIFKRREVCKFRDFLVQVYESLIKPFSTDNSIACLLSSHLFLVTGNDDEHWYKPVGLLAESLPRARTAWLQIGVSANCGTRSENPSICISHRPTVGAEPNCKELFSYPRKRMFTEALQSIANPQLILDWLSICTNNHAETCVHTGNSFKRNFLKTRYIDVRNRCVVSEIGDQPYVALSYVWGERPKSTKGSNKTSQDKSTSRTTFAHILPEDVPKTITDAMKLAADIGFNFLWVDRYCIDQDDENDKQSQIANMHLIFECAYLTIIALDAASMQAGIAGISRRFKYTAQPEVEMGGGKFMATYVDTLKNHQGNSPWDERAWTLQESLLSKRCLYFDSSSFYMVCREEFFHDLLEPDLGVDRNGFVVDNQDVYWQNGFEIDLTPSTFSRTNYGAFVDNFTLRKLTSETDALNACTAALTRISTSTGVGFNWGLPIKDFAQALLWHCDPNGFLQRRPQFPSWSWLGWIGRIACPYFLEEYEDYCSDLSTKDLTHQRFDADTWSSRSDAFFHHDVDKNHEASIRIERVGNVDETRILQISSTVARFHLAKVETNTPKYHPNQVGIRWTLLDRKGTPLINEVGENTGDVDVEFQTINYFCRLSPKASKAIEAHGFQADILFIKYWPAIRDQHKLNNWRRDIISGLLLTANSDGTYAREAAILMKRRDWLAAHPFPRVIKLR